jgi:hypothetical protein
MTQYEHYEPSEAEWVRWRERRQLTKDELHEWRELIDRGQALYDSWRASATVTDREACAEGEPPESFRALEWVVQSVTGCYPE